MMITCKSIWDIQVDKLALFPFFDQQSFPVPVQFLLLRVRQGMGMEKAESDYHFRENICHSQGDIPTH